MDTWFKEWLERLGDGGYPYFDSKQFGKDLETAAEEVAR